MTTSSATLQSPFAAFGGTAGVRRAVDRFYDLMDSVPAYHALRALHADDLTPMRHSLTGFLTAWLGGPRDWFEEHPGKCMMSLHAPIAIDAVVADLWVAAMTQAMADVRVEPALAQQAGAAFQRMATQMVRT